MIQLYSAHSYNNHVHSYHITYLLEYILQELIILMVIHRLDVAISCTVFILNIINDVLRINGLHIKVDRAYIPANRI